MGKELYALLEKEPDDELFYCFKHDGSPNFAEKIIAGDILFKRGYDKEILKIEKQKNIDHIQSQITAYGDKTDIERTNRKKIFTNTGACVGFIILFLLLDIFRNHANAVPFNKTNVWILSGVALAYIVFRLIRFKKEFKKRNDNVFKDIELQRNRIMLIEDEWKFD